MKDFKGLYTDSNYLKNPAGTWQDGKNLLLSKKFNSPVNENGTKFSHLVRGKVRGLIETNIHIVYFSIIQEREANSLISVYNINTGTLTENLKGNFNFNRPIEGVYKYDYKNNLIVVWCDGVFENSVSPKICKITNIDLPLTGILLKDENLDLINLFPNINKGIITVKPSEGNIVGLYAYVTFKYCYKNEETNFKDLNTYSFISKYNGSEYINTGLKLEFKDLDYVNYDSIKIGLYIVGETENLSYISNRISIQNSTKEVNITSLSNFLQISNEDLLLPKERFSKVETITQHKDSLLIGKTKKNEVFKFQKFANLLKLKPNFETVNADYYAKQENPKLILMNNEVYAFFIQCELNNGDITEWFHIPNLDYTSEDLQNVYEGEYAETYKLDLNNFDENQEYKNFHFNNKGTEEKFGVWFNKEEYPNNEEYNSSVDYNNQAITNGVDLRGKRISFHRVKDNDPQEFTEYSRDEPIRACTGVNIENLEDIPSSIRNQIKNIRIGFAKRNTGNSLVFSEGIAVNMAAVNSPSFSDFEGLNDNPSSPFVLGNNLDYTQDPLIKGASFDRILFLSQEIEKFKPSLNFNVVSVSGLKIRTTAPGVVGYQDINNLEDFNKNKYYYGSIGYNYKLPNNISMGSDQVDGGLNINFTPNADSTILRHVEGDSSFGRFSFLPFSFEEFKTTNNDTLEPVTDKILYVDDVSFLVAAKIQLLSFSDNLYNLNPRSIVSSLNTLNIEEIDSTSTFKVGDCTYSNITGSIEYLIKEVDYLRPSIAGLKNLNNITSLLDSYLVKSDTVYEHTDQNSVVNVRKIGFEVEAPEKKASLNDLASYESFNFLQPYLKFDPYLIIRSNIAPNEGFIINSFRTFFANNYYKIQNNKGDIIALRSNDEYLYIQLRNSLLLAQVKDVITTENTDAFLQTRDIFDRPPKSLTLEPKGYIGCEHKFACKITKEGYITIDHKQGIIILATPSIKIISSIGNRNYFLEKLEFKEEDLYEEVNGILQPIDDPYNYIGFSIGYDYTYNRLFINKLYPEVLKEIKDLKTYYQSFLNKPNTVFTDKIHTNNPNSFSISYSLDTSFWLFNHDLIVNYYIQVKKDLYGLRNAKYNSNNYNFGSSHILNKGNKGEYFGIKYSSYIDIIFNTAPNQSKIYDFIKLITEVSKFKTSEVIIEDKPRTISRLIVFNDEQCSGEILLDVNNFDIIREVEGEFKINNFRDLVINPSLPIFNEMGELNLSNLNFNKNWFDKSYFISKFIVVRCIWDNLTNEDIYLNEIQIASKISQR